MREHPQKRKHFFRLLQAESDRRASVETDLRIRLRQQEAVASFGEFALSCQSLNVLLDSAVQVVVQILEVQFCKILELLPGEQEMLLRAGYGWHEGLVGTQRIGTGVDSQSGYTLLTDEPIIVNDMTTETRFSSSPLFTDHGIIRGMSVVIRGETQPWGVLGAHTVTERIFTNDDAQFLKSMANVIASSIERFSIDMELRRSRDELAVILDGVSEGVTAVDRTGKLVYANEAAAKLMGFESVEAVMKVPWEQLLQRYEMLDEDGSRFPLEKLPNRIVLQGQPHASARLRFRTLPEGVERWSIADASAIYNPNGEVAFSVTIFRDITAMMRAERSQKLLNEASQVFAASLDQHANLASLGRLAVENLADWCTIHLIKPDGSVEEVVVAHKDPKKIELARDLGQRFPQQPREDAGLYHVMRTGQPEYYPLISEEMLRQSALNEDHYESLRQLGMRAAMIIPLKARSNILGAISLIWADSERVYDEEDVRLVQELANRAAIATENSQLFEQAQALNMELEQRVEKRTQQLVSSYQQLMVEVEERRKAEAALQKSQILLNSLFESAPDATVIVDQNGAIYNVNIQAENVFGYPREALIGAKIDQLLLEGARYHATLEQLISQAQAFPLGSELEFTAQRRDGSQFPVNITLSPLQTETEPLVISSIRDVTEQKRLQRELMETHRRLFESVEAERLLLSQELHDGPLQDLYGIALYLESIRELMAEEEEPEDITLAKESVQSVISTLRAICGDLRPPSLAQFGLEKAIRSHMIKFQQTHPALRIEPRLMADGKRLPERTRLALFRVYQNSLSNILRHAQASEVKVDFLIDTERATLRIQDNGRGFNVPQKWVELARGGHFGLVGMMERVEAVGGHLTVQSARGAGTTIQVDVPLSEN